MKTRKICLMLGILIISVFYVTPNQLKAADNTQADIIDKYVLKDGLEIDKINSINGEEKTTSNVKDGTSKIVQNSLVSTVGEVGSTVAVNIVNNGIQNLGCSFTVLEKSENGNFGTVQVGESDVNYSAIDRSTVGTIEIPNEINLASGAKYKVTSISEFAFFNCSSITNTGLAKNTTITTIDANAFKGCSSLKSTELETNTGITKLGGNAFQGCTSLISTGLEKNTTITSVDPGIFAGCSSLTSTGLETNKAINYISTSMFEKCTSLTSTGLETNTSVTRLGWKVFLGCSSLTSTGLGTNKDITYLEDNTFAFCASLTSTGLETNKGIKGLGNYAFKGCNSITSTGLETNTTITRLMNSVFEGCGSLTNTGLGTNTTITKIGGRAFFGDTKIKNIVFLIDQLPAMKSDTFSNTNVEIYYLPEVTIKPTIASTGAKAVHELSVQNIILKNKASKLNYIEGQEFEPSGLELTVNYDMGHKRVIKYDDTTKANFSFDKTVLSLKDTEITVTYCGKPATLPITVVKKKLIKTEVKRNIDKVDYIEEETFDPRGLELELTYDNGKSEVIKYDDTTKTKFTFDKTVLSLKDTEITVTYEGQNITLPITVVKKKLVKTEVKSNTAKDDYIEGETFDPKGLELELKYDNGKSEVIKYDNTTKTKFTFDKTELSLEDTEIIVTYGGKPATLPITVVKKKVVNAKVIRNIDKVDYIEGEALDPKGLEIEVKYNNGKSEVIKYNDATKANFTFDKMELSLKDTKITVTYGGKPATLPITVVKKKVVNAKVIRNIDKVDYIEGETLDPKGLEIEVKYNNGKSEVITYDDTTKAKFTFDKTELSLKDTEIIVTYGGHTVTLPISVTSETNKKERKGPKEETKVINEIGTSEKLFTNTVNKDSIGKKIASKKVNKDSKQKIVAPKKEIKVNEGSTAKSDKGLQINDLIVPGLCIGAVLLCIIFILVKKNKDEDEYLQKRKW